MSKYTREQVDAAIKAQEAALGLLNLFHGKPEVVTCDILSSSLTRTGRAVKRCAKLDMVTVAQIDEVAASALKEVPK